jgi:predicted small lipoprotein YifL
MLRRLIVSLCFILIIGALAACGQPEPAPMTEAAAPAATEAPAAQAQPTEAMTEIAATEAPAAGGAVECSWAGSGATMAHGDKRFNFDCGKNGDFFVGLFGEITQGDKGWEITQAEIKNDPVVYQNAKTVLVTHIILDDGTNCAFAGLGATTGIGDKRLNFTCGENGDYTIGLFGDITLGDKGWEITKGEVKITNDGPVSQNVTTAIIAKLGVEPE